MSARATTAMIVLAVALAGCAPQASIGPSTPLPPTPAPSCDAVAYARLIGQPAATIDPASLPARHRIVCADCAMTMDYSADRLTIRLDPEGKVAAVACQ
ncbi:MAG: hypothetical protein KJS97_02810 [Alphaproteobacteria bacterium]|nr:hypothetical protein [Alphaproteobacteria bacterium]